MFPTSGSEPPEAEVALWGRWPGGLSHPVMLQDSPAKSPLASAVPGCPWKCTVCIAGGAVITVLSQIKSKLGLGKHLCFPEERLLHPCPKSPKGVPTFESALLLQDEVRAEEFYGVCASAQPFPEVAHVFLSSLLINKLMNSVLILHCPFECWKAR